MKNKTILYAFIVMIAFVFIIILSIDLKDNNISKKDSNKKEEKEDFLYTPLMYKVCDDDSCIYLLGSIHLGDDRITKFSDTILNAYKESDILAVELEYDLDDIGIGDMYLEDGKTVKDFISNELDEKLKKFSLEHSMFTYDLFSNFKLGYLSNVMSSIIYMELGYINPGVDFYFIDQAHKDKKEVISLETIEEQMNLLFNYSDEFYINQINDVIDNYDTLKDETKKLYESYIEGDLEKLREVIDIDASITGAETEEEKQYIKAILDDRNERMTERVKDFLESNSKVFMTVGAAHVSGTNGIIERLGKDYKISIVK